MCLDLAQVDLRGGGGGGGSGDARAGGVEDPAKKTFQKTHVQVYR